MEEKRTNQPFATYVVWGRARAPEVHSLTQESYRRYLAFPQSKRLLAIQAVFGAGMDTAIPAWSQGAMELIALNYEGEHQVRVRYICAAIALNRPYGPDDPKGPQGGTKVEVPKGPPPKGPKPRARVMDLADAAV